VNWAFNRPRPIFAHVLLVGFPVQSKTSAMQQAAPYLGLGVQLASTVLISGAIGYWIDIEYAMTPIGVLAGVVIGSVVGLVQFLRTVQRLARRENKADEVS
jgi:F0F1-type ATP synthase assembly protein I